MCFQDNDLLEFTIFTEQISSVGLFYILLTFTFDGLSIYPGSV